jgi:hypothetical protein
MLELKVKAKFLSCACIVLVLLTCMSSINVQAKSSVQLVVSSYGTIEYSVSPTPTTNPVNYAPIPSAWDLTFGDNPQYAFVDYSVTHNGNPSIRVQPDYAGIREVDTDAISVKPGDHIVISCWIKTSSSSSGLNGNDWFGGRIGIDLYCAGHILYSHPTDDEGHASWVAFGTDNWTYKQFDFIVPSTWYTQDMIGLPVSPSQISFAIPWLQVVPATDTGLVWFADCTMQINP